MKLEISEAEAFFYSTIFASCFVFSIYIWKPIVAPPAEIHKLRQKKVHRLNYSERQTIDDYEIRMRMKSVGILVCLAVLFLICRSRLSER